MGRVIVNNGDKIFIDANVLIFILYPANNPYKYSRYISIITILQQQQCQMYINSLVVSEFINRLLRDDFYKLKDQNPNIEKFKQDYRNTQNYNDTLQFAITELDKFCKIYNIKHINDNFDKINIVSLYANGYSFDFNDLIIADNVRSNGFRLLTDDRDFQSLNVALV